MLNWALIVAFVPTFLFVSFTPGMCMTLSMTLGITVGVKRALWMMLGELVGVAIVAICAVVGVAAIMLGAPIIFTAFKWLGGLYLGWLGLQMWRSKGKMAIPTEARVENNVSPKTLITQGFITAIANPKGWAFFMVLLPPFIDDSLPMPMQLSVLVLMILTIEFVALLSYASGGQTLSRLLAKSSNVKLLNRISGTLMIGVAFWLALG